MAVIMRINHRKQSLHLDKIMFWHRRIVKFTNLQMQTTWRQEQQKPRVPPDVGSCFYFVINFDKITIGYVYSINLYYIAYYKPVIWVYIYIYNIRE